MKSPESRKLLLLILGVLSLPALGQEPKTNRAPINVSADRATYESGQGVYEGRVELRQGKLSISADKLIIDEQNRQVDRILALGKPAQLNQEDGSVSAEARSIEYFVANGKVILKENAYIRQQGSEIRGKEITYDSQQQTVLAEGGNNPQRVEMTLQPRQVTQPPDEKTPDSTSKAKGSGSSSN